MDGCKLLIMVAVIKASICEKTYLDVKKGYQSRSVLQLAMQDHINSWTDCTTMCHLSRQCASMNYMESEERCTLLVDKDPKPMKVEGKGAFYADVLNRNPSDVCPVSEWSAWAWQPLSVTCFYETEHASVSRSRLILQNESSLVPNCPQLYHSYIDTQYCMQFQNNCIGVSTLGSDLPPTITYNYSIIGTPMHMYNELPSIQQCRCLCQKNFKCQTASFSNNGTCLLYTKVSNQGLVFNTASAIVDLHISDKTRILVIGGHNGTTLLDTIFLVIPETQTCSVVAHLNAARMWNAAALYDNKLWTHGHGDGRVEVSKGLPIQMQTVTELDMPSFMMGCSTVFNHQFYACQGDYCDTWDVNSLDMSRLTNTFLGTNIDGAPACAKGPDNQFYVFGGNQNPTGHLRMDLNDGTTVPGANFPTPGLPGDGGQAVWFQDTVVVCGGSSTVGGGSAVCDRFNPSTGQWIGFPNMLRPRHVFALVNWGQDKILAISGRSFNPTYHVHKEVDVYSNGAWSFLMNLTYHIRGAPAITID